MKEVRRRIAEEQRKDPRVMKIITKLLETQSEQAEEHKDPVPTHGDSDSAGATTDQHDQPVSRNESSELGLPSRFIHYIHNNQAQNNIQDSRLQRRGRKQGNNATNQYNDNTTYSRGNT